MAKRLTQDERDLIAELDRLQLGPTEIGRRLNRHHSVIARELRRNRSDDGRYRAAAAHQAAIRRRKERPMVRKMERQEISTAVHPINLKPITPRLLRRNLWLRRYPKVLSYRSMAHAILKRWKCSTKCRKMR